MSTNNRSVLDEQSFPTFCAQLKVTSPVIRENGMIPLQYTCEGVNINPALDIEAVPPGTKSLAIIMEDLDATGDVFVHWVAWNIPVVRHICEARKMEAPGFNDFHVSEYKGPCPAYGTHRYIFKVYALDSLLAMSRHTAADLEEAMNGHIIGFGQLMARYRRR